VTGRRAEHKAATRNAIAQASQQLLRARGYDAVSVNDIADAAGVGYRTFYRYFAGKQDAALALFQDYLDIYIAEVEARPLNEHPMDSLLGAVRSSADLVEQIVGSDLEDMLRWAFHLVETVPEVAARQHFLAVQAQDRLAHLLAARIGQPPNSMQARIYAASSTAAYHAATRCWAHREYDGDPGPSVWELACTSMEAFRDGLGAQGAPVQARGSSTAATPPVRIG